MLQLFLYLLLLTVQLIKGALCSLHVLLLTLHGSGDVLVLVLDRG